MNKSMEWSFECGKYYEWGKWINEIPFIKFDSEWEVQIVPPFTGAIVRFRVKKGDKEVSIYLDCYDILGYQGEPYWELYPLNDTTFRCRMKDVDGLLIAIREALQ